MTLPLDEPLPLPWSIDSYGNIRISGTRITIDLLFAYFEADYSPEYLIEQFPTLKPADVYLVKAFYLLHPEESREHLRLVREEYARLRAKIEAELGTGEETNRKVLERAASGAAGPVAQELARKELALREQEAVAPVSRRRGY